MRLPSLSPFLLVVLFAIPACAPFHDAASWRGDQGIVRGGIEPCNAISETVTHGRKYLGGTVTVFPLHLVHPSPGHPLGLKVIVSPRAVAQTQVKTNGTYRFALPAGWYELRARVRSPRATYTPRTPVKVVRHTITHVDIPDMCI